MSGPLRCAVTIATRNRRDDLARTCAVLQALQPPPDEVLVCADGCTDGTVEFVREQYPGVRLIVHEQARGSIPSRNELAAATACDVFVSLDDDSYPIETDAIARIRALFELNPRLAVAAFPQRTDEYPATLSAQDFGTAKFAGSYANSAAAIRTSVFKSLGGYPGFFFHAYEEPDFALRCAAAGWQVRFEPCVTVRHHFSATERNEIRTHQRHARNELWSVLLRCPMPQLLAVAPFRVWRQFLYASRRGWPWVWREPAWWFRCLGGIPRCLRERAALAWPRYRGWMQLVRTPIENAAEWEARFGT
jgi:GT2 family glycosyltransferase